MAYTDYKKFIYAYMPLVGLTTGGLEQDENKNYIVTYAILNEANDVFSLGYYGPNSIEAENFATANYKSDLSVLYQSILNHYGPNDTYMLFADVAKIQFSEIPVGSDSGTVITFGQLNDTYPVFDSSNPAGNVDGGGNIFPGNSNAAAFSIGGLASTIPTGQYGDIWINASQPFWDSLLSLQSQQFKVLLEETIHSLGVDLYAPENRQDADKFYDAEGVLYNGGNPLVPEMEQYNNQKYTVTSYFNAPEINGAPWTLQLMDIAALQSLYGRNYEKLASNTTFTLDGMNPNANKAQPFLYTIWDGGGNDTLDISGLNNTLQFYTPQIDLRQGRFSSIGNDSSGNSVAIDSEATTLDPDPGNVATAFHSVIENTKGTNYNDILIGNAWSNRLEGGSGNDWLYGDGISYDGNEGFTDIDPNDPDDPNRTKPASNNDNDWLNGGSGDDILFGGAGNDRLIGGSDDDILHGGDGDSDIADYLSNPAAITVLWNADGTLKVRDGWGNIDTLDGIEIISGKFGAANTLELYGAGTLQESAPGQYLFNGHALTLEGVSAIKGDSADQVFLLQTIPSVGLDGGAGNDTLVYAGAGGIITNDINNKLYSGAGETLTLAQNIEHVSVTAGFGARVVDPNGVTAPVASAMNDYSSASTDAVFSINEKLGLHVTEYLFSPEKYRFNPQQATTVELGGDLQYRIVQMEFGVNRIFSSGELNLAYDYLGDLASGSRHDLQNNIRGTDHGDTYNLNLNSLFQSYTTSNIVTGYGDDIVNIAISSVSPTSLTYTAGHDVIHGASHLSALTMWADIRPQDVSTSFATNTQTITVAGHGTVTLDGLSAPVNIIYAGENGSATISGSWGTDVWMGYADRDEVFYGYGGDDILNGSGGQDVIYGGDGNDTLMSFSGANTLSGNAGDDSYVVSKNALTTISDSEGVNTIRLVDISSTELSVALDQGGLVFMDGNRNSIVTFSAESVFSDVIFQGGVQASYATLYLQALSSGLQAYYHTTDSADFISASSTSNQVMIDLGSGDDSFFGRSNSTTPNTVYGGGGRDAISGGRGADTLYGGIGNDSIDGRAGNDFINGGDGNDRVFFESATHGVDVNLDTGVVSDDGTGGQDTLASIEYVIGTNFSDHIIGLNSDNYIESNGGDDVLIGLGGNDWFEVSDHLNGHVTIDGGDGRDTISFINTDGGSGVVADLGAGIVYDNGFGEMLTITGIENIWASLDNGGDITGSDAANEIQMFFSGVARGMGGDDFLYTGGGGPVTFYGGDGNDTLIGGKFNDILAGGAGNDLLQGGDGNDVYVFASGDGFDIIRDYVGRNILDVQGGLTINDLVTTRSGNNLVIHIASGVTIENFFDDFYGAGTFDISFPDGSLYDLYTLPLNNQMPVAQNDDFFVIPDTVLTGNVLSDNGHGTDSDPDGNALQASASSMTTINGGTFNLADDGSFTYTPSSGFEGVDKVTYTLSDGFGAEAMGIVNILVTAINSPPESKNDTFTIDEDTSLSGNFLADNGFGPDQDSDGDVLSVIAGNFTTLNGGALSIQDDGTFSYVPAANFNGNDSFEYTLSDNQGGTDTAVASIHVNPINDVPEVRDDIFTGVENSEIEGNLLADNGFGVDFDLDGDVFKVVQTIISSAAGGSVILMHNGDFVYMPPAKFYGTDSFSYTVTDEHGGQASATATMNIAPLNDAPEAQDDSFATTLLSSVIGNVLNNNGTGADSDPDGDSLNVRPDVIFTQNGGMVSINDDGSFVYTPSTGFTGQDSFDYTLLDGEGSEATGTVFLSVTTKDGQITGSQASNTLYGTNKADTMIAFAGNDTLHGNNGNDLMIGGAGNDTLKGGNGNDLLIGGDVLYSQRHFDSDNVAFPNLQERKYIGNLDPSGVPVLGVVDGDLSSDAPASATITFLSTGAGYNNSLGVYNIAADGTIQSVGLAFANVKSVAAGTAQTIALPGTPDSDFGFFIISDGARNNANFKNIDLDGGDLNFYYHFGQADQRIAKVTDDGDDISLIYTNGSQQKVIQGDVYHTTERAADPLLNADEAVHTVSGLSDANHPETLRIGFEDLRNTGDADYNDVVFDFSYAPDIRSTNLPDGNDTLYGGNGDDVLIGGRGNDTLYGGTGADTFKFLSADDGTDTIKDFKASQGDKIDIAGVIDDYDPVTDILSQFVQITQHGKDTVISVDADGGGDSFAALAIIGNTNHFDLQTFVANGNLIV